jgi:hypothetical protein
MKTIKRFRYVLIAVLLLVLYFLDRGNMAVNHQTYWLFTFVLIAGMMFKRLDRIEGKLDAMTRKE